MYMQAGMMYIPQEGSMAATSSVRHKHIRIDQAKLEKAKKVLSAATETEALDRALTLVVGEADIDATLRRVGGKGKIEKRFA